MLHTHAKQFNPVTSVIVGNMTNDANGWITQPADELRTGGIGPYINDPRGSPFGVNAVFQIVDSRTNQEMFINTLNKMRMPLTKQYLAYAKALLPVQISNLERLIMIVALRDIDPGEEVFINYGETHFNTINGL